MRDARRWSLSVAVLAFASSAVLSLPAAAEQRTPTQPDPFRAIAREQTPIVVAIKTTTWLDPAASEDADWFERFFGRAFRAVHTSNVKPRRAFSSAPTETS